jgi:hypothetical protein
MNNDKFFEAEIIYAYVRLRESLRIFLIYFAQKYWRIALNGGSVAINAQYAEIRLF